MATDWRLFRLCVYLLSAANDRLAHGRPAPARVVGHCRAADQVAVVERHTHRRVGRRVVYPAARPVRIQNLREVSTCWMVSGTQHSSSTSALTDGAAGFGQDSVAGSLHGLVPVGCRSLCHLAGPRALSVHLAVGNGASVAGDPHKAVEYVPVVRISWWCTGSRWPIRARGKQ